MATFFDHLARGALAGAAGTTALNATTYLDMVARGRPGSSTPEKTVERTADSLGTSIPGDSEARQARASALGALLGIVAGVGTGAALGAMRAAGRPRSPVTTVLAASALATVAGNAPMSALGVTDPRRWAPADWAADLVPHLVYGVVAQVTLDRLDPSKRRVRLLRRVRGGRSIRPRR
ncbi:hypothetical protein [Phytoactinopolyspora halotolerans]|uniref:DUF1440 domain-containing protein n=1 Tax=Phytoactinopolyspora halotolerans TaxID=1981512 RepID=A0A6L9S8W6_9ACTN|nr:hypothetical protein [Phytoactinopolyspora halotolerans]NEE01463.1 hypothetical protein [Phytoactinopolyspora halotolerans]